jgi:hypothetical protein
MGEFVLWILAFLTILAAPNSIDDDLNNAQYNLGY